MTTRLLVTVYIVAAGALCLLLAPGDFKGLAAIPALALWALWAGTRRHGAHEFDTELDEVAAHECPRCAGCDQPWHTCPACYTTTYHNDPPELVGRVMERVELGPAPDELAHPVEHYAWRARRSVWQQRGPEESAHLLPELPPMTGPTPPTPAGPEHTAELDPVDAELALWPDRYAMQFDAVLERTRANFDLLRRMNR